MRHLTRIVRDVWLNGVIGSAVLPRPLRWRLLKISGLRVARSAISPGCWFGGTDIEIGEATFLNHGCFLDNAAPIIIGRDVAFGPQVLLLTGTHEIGGPERRAGAARARPVQVGDGVWIGARAIIQPGVTVGAGCIIAAGSVVVGDCAPHGMYAGTPATRIRELGA